MAAFPAVALPVSTHAVRNNRRKMEDRHVTLPDLNCVLDIQDAPQHSYYAVFDGHAGLEAANYATAHLHRNIVMQPDFLSDPVHAIHEGFAATDRNFLQRSSKEGMKSGCTAVCCLVREQSHLYVGWLGDSQAMLARRGVALPLVNPHKPEREDERKRIEDLGGMVVMMGIWRVNGSLAVSRAIGDAEHKPYVISEPDVLSVELDGSEDFLVLGCDGLWDQLMPQDVANRVYQAVLDDPDGAPYVSHALVQGARDLGSGDNITAIVVFLRDPHTFDAASLSQAVSCPALEKTAVSELPTPPVGDSGNVFDGPSDDLVQVATGVVRETIETALHRVNDDAAAARDIVEQVHQMHSEQEVGKFTDLPEHFYGAAPVEKSGGGDDVVGPANGFLGGTVDSPGGRRNPFEDEGYERDVDAASDTNHMEESRAELDAKCNVAESGSGFPAEDREPHAEFQMPDGQSVAEGTLNVDESSARDGSPAVVQEGFYDEMFQFSAPDPLQHNVDALAHVAENCASNILEQPTSFQEHEYPDEGVDVGHVPEELQEQVPALAEQFTEGASDQHIVPAVPVDLCADVDQNVGAIPEDQHAQHSLLFETNFGHAKEAAEPQTDFFGQQLSPKTFSVLPEGDQVQYVSPEHFGYVTGEKEELSSSPNLHQQMSVLSDDLVSIDLNASATQSLSDAVAVDIAGQVEPGAEAPCQVESQEPHRNILTESIPEAQEAYPHGAGEVSENLGIEDAEDLSPAGSAESVVEKVAAEAQQESAVVFCQLKETPVSDEQNLFGESQLNETSISAQNLFGANQLSENIEEPVDNQTAAFTSQPPLHFATEPWEGKESAVDDPHDNLGDFGASNFYADRPSTLSTVPEDLHNFLMSQQLAQSILERSEETKSPKSEATQLPEPTSDSQKSTHVADARATVQESVDFDSSSVQTPEHVLSGKGTSPEASVPSGLEFTVAVEQSSETKPEITQVSLEEAQHSKEDQSSLTESSNVKPVSEDPSAPVDFGKIPENIPEADGVTEDSDSEKDGGWRFVKPTESAKKPTEQADAAPKQTEVALKQVEVAPKQDEVSSKKSEVSSKPGTLAAAKRKSLAGTPKTGTTQPPTKRPSSAARPSAASKSASPSATVSTAASKSASPSTATSTAGKKESTVPGKLQPSLTKAATAGTTTLAAPRKPLVPSTRPVATKAPLAPKAKPAPTSTLRAKPTAPVATKSATAVAEKKTAAPARPSLTKTAPKPSAAPASAATRATSSTATSRQTASATARTGTTSKVTSTLTKKTVDTTAPRTAATRPAAAVRDTKLSKEATNQQLSGARKPLGTAPSKTATTRPTTSTLRNVAAAKAPAAKVPAPKTSAARAVPKLGLGIKKSGTEELAAKNDGKQNGVPEEKGSLEQNDKEQSACPVPPLSNGHPSDSGAGDATALKSNLLDPMDVSPAEI
uniref:Protein phosphatase 2c n=2 Tax=Ixodes ricinus TaxID=34613 RepID=V5GLI4_IXORI